MRQVIFWMTLLVLGLAQTPGYGQTRLERIYQSMHPRPKWVPPQPETPRQNNDHTWTPQTDNNGNGGELILLGAVVVTAPVWLPSLAFDQKNLSFTKYPYARDVGQLSSTYPSDQDQTALDYWENDRLVKDWTVRASIDTGNNFDGLNRLGGQLFLDTNFYRLGLVGNLDWYRENNPFGNSQDAVMTDLNLTFRVTQSRSLVMHVGLGGRLWNSLGDVSGGINAFYRGDFYPIRPVNISTIYEIGNLDQSLFMRLRSQVGFNWRHGEIFVGYDWTRVANVTLQGPLVGLRLWF